MTYLYLFLWILFSILEGIREAHYFDAFPKPPKKYDIHQLFTFQRLVILIGISPDWVYGIVYALIFPFIHDGVYYWFRNRLNVVVYQNKFWSNPSASSTAVLDFRVWERIWFFILGVVGIIVYEIVKYTLHFK